MPFNGGGTFKKLYLKNFYYENSTTTRGNSIDPILFIK